MKMSPARDMATAFAGMPRLFKFERTRLFPAGSTPKTAPGRIVATSKPSARRAREQTMRCDEDAGAGSIAADRASRCGRRAAVAQLDIHHVENGAKGDL